MPAPGTPSSFPNLYPNPYGQTVYSAKVLYNGFRRDTLKLFLKNRGLAQDGYKSDLVDRLIDNDRRQPGMIL